MDYDICGSDYDCLSCCSFGYRVFNAKEVALIMDILDWLVGPYCKHSWETVSVHVQKSPLQILVEDGNSHEVDGKGDLLRGTHVFIQNCNKCGRVYKSVTKV